MKMASFIILVWALTVAVGYGETPAVEEDTAKDKTGAAAYEVFREPYRTHLIQNWQQAVDETKTEIRKLTEILQTPIHTPRGTPRTTDMKKKPGRQNPPARREAPFGEGQKQKQEEQKAELWRMTRHLKELEENDPPYLHLYIPATAGRWEVGNFGTPEGDSRRQLTVEQVISKNKMLVRCQCPANMEKIPADDTLVLFSGFPTSGITDGKALGMPQFIIITGTTTYATAAGGTKTVLVVKPLDFNSLKMSDKELREAREAAEAARWRTWTDSTGAHKTEAKFGGLVTGKVTLIKRNGTSVEVPLEKLSAEDQEWIKAKKWKQ
jgi:hypothetical protein